MANETEVKLAQDYKSNNMQMAHLNTAKFLAITTTVPVQISTEYDQQVVFSGPSNAFIQVRKTATTALANQGFQYMAGTYYHTTVKKGEWISSSAPIHVCALGESIEA